ELRRFGVDPSFIVRQKGRFGIYFVEPGANQRPSKVVYDPDYSPITLAKPGDIDWRLAFQRATMIPRTGSTPPLRQSAAHPAIESVQKARTEGLTVSCDLNYRKNLWKYGKAAKDIMTELFRHVDIGIANEGDCQMSLGIQVDVDVPSGELE